jgi:hypothetical protein
MSHKQKFLNLVIKVTKELKRVKKNPLLNLIKSININMYSEEFSSLLFSQDSIFVRFHFRKLKNELLELLSETSTKLSGF